MKNLFSLILNLDTVESVKKFSLSTEAHSDLSERRMLVSREDFKDKEILWTFYNRDSESVDILEREIKNIDKKVRETDSYDVAKQIVFSELSKVLDMYDWSPISEEVFFTGNFIDIEK